MTYINITDHSFIICVIPVKFMIIINLDISIKTTSSPNPPNNGTGGALFLPSCYLKEVNFTWSYVYTPLNNAEQFIVNNLSKISSSFNSLTTLNGIQ